MLEEESEAAIDSTGLEAHHISSHFVKCSKGLFKHYATLLNTSSSYAILQLIGFRIFGNYDGHKQCPCESGKNTMQCHAVVMNHLWDIPAKCLKKDFEYMLRDYFTYYKRRF